ncbi:glycosyltransferase family 2 protein [Candidatus Woesearchaeota archaeon]|nr:glycosyltransferase family 2 protein [Candidatus Woesearchaeota archaeon]
MVVDNNSKDNSVAKIKKEFPQTEIIENKTNKGYGAACNQAIKIAQGNHTLILNPDITLETNTVEELLKYLEQNKEAKIVSCKLENANGTLQDSFREFPTIISLLRRQFKAITTKESILPQKVDWVSGALMLLRDKYYFDERFFLYFEDVDLCKTVGNVYYYPLVSATHTAQRESKQNLKLAILHAKSALKYFLKHGFF